MTIYIYIYIHYCCGFNRAGGLGIRHLTSTFDPADPSAPVARTSLDVPCALDASEEAGKGFGGADGSATLSQGNTREGSIGLSSADSIDYMNT